MTRALSRQCPSCGDEWSSSCELATPPSWDPTLGVRSTDEGRHPFNVAYRTGSERGGAAGSFLVFVVLLVALIAVGLLSVANGQAREACERAPAACELVDEGSGDAP